MVCTSYETLKAVSLIKRNLKKVRTILGISNISFSLPIPLRPALNSIFLQDALEHGLDMAILNPAANINLDSIPKKNIDICRRLIFNKDNGLENFTNHFSDNKGSKKQKNTQSMSKILYFKILKGDKSNLEYII